MKLMKCRVCHNDIVGEYRVCPFAFGEFKEEIGINVICNSCTSLYKWKRYEQNIPLSQNKHPMRDYIKEKNTI